MLLKQNTKKIYDRGTRLVYTEQEEGNKVETSERKRKEKQQLTSFTSLKNVWCDVKKCDGDEERERGIKKNFFEDEHDGCEW